jgi:hypothetical protein
MNISSLNNPSSSSSIGSGSTSNPAVDADKLAPRSQNDSVNRGKSGVSTASAVVSASFEDKRQTALQIVNRTLEQAYEKISSRGQAASAEYGAFEPLTAEKVANNILGFIERRLQMDVADGATQEELQARLEAGLSGFKKGFAEASEKLKALSLLSPQIKADIDKTYDLVIAGVDDLRSKFIQATTEQIPAKSTGVAPETLKTVDPKTTVSTSPAPKLEVPGFLPTATSSYVGYGNYEYGRAREFSFQLTTKEGDKITIKASSSEGLAVEAASATRGGQSASALNASYSSSQSFSLSVEGDLSEAELTAINDLLGRVNDLAGQFFNGNLDTAFAQAMNLGYDADQIGSFSLNLVQVEIQQVKQAYQAFEPERVAGDADNRTSLVNQLLPVGNFIKNLLDSLERASVFNEPKLLVSNMAEKITGESEIDQLQGKRFRDFIEELFALELR